MEVVVLFGGRSVEHDVSIITAVQLMANIDRKKHNVYPIYLRDGNMYTSDALFDISFYQNPNLKKCINLVLINGIFYRRVKNIIKKVIKPDVAILCCHGGEGENGTIQAIMEYNKIPYTSSGINGSAVTMDKVTTKQILEGLMMNVLPSIVVHRDDFLRHRKEVLLHIETFLEYPMFIKPSSLGSSIGVSRVNARDELEKGLELSCYFDEKVIIEKALTGFIELNCACVRSGDEIIVSDVEKPESMDEILSFSDKYLSGGKGMDSSLREFPANIPKNTYSEIQEMTKQIYLDLNLLGVVRIDYMMTSDNKLFVNEINSIPGSMAYYLFKDLRYKDLIEIMIHEGISREIDNKKSSISYKSDILKSFQSNGSFKQLQK